MIKLQNLYVRQVIKNYIETCKLLGEKVKSGESKQLQLKDWGRYFKFHKEGQSFIIDEIYDQPLKKINKRVDGNNSIYFNHIQLLIVDLLAQQQQGKHGCVYLSINKLLKELNMVNDNYVVGKRNMLKLSNFLEISYDDVYEFYENTHSSLKTALETALKKLKNKAIISYCTVETVVMYSTKQHREATVDEINLIRDTEKKILEKLDLENKSDVVRYKKWDDFINQVNKMLFETAKIDYYYESCVIRYTQKYVLQEIDLLTNKLRIEEKKQLNDKVINKLNINAEKRQEKSKIKELKYLNDLVNQLDLDIKDEFISNLLDGAKDDNKELKIIKLRLSENYLDNYKKLIKLLIDETNKTKIIRKFNKNN